jgi:hypothetical protein
VGGLSLARLPIAPRFGLLLAQIEQFAPKPNSVRNMETVIDVFVELVGRVDQEFTALCENNGYFAPLIVLLR